MPPIKALLNKRNRPFKTTSSFYRKVKTYQKNLLQSSSEINSLHKNSVPVVESRQKLLTLYINKDHNYTFREDLSSNSSESICESLEIGSHDILKNIVNRSDESDSNMNDYHDDAQIENKNYIEKIDNKVSVLEELRIWALRQKISHSALNNLLRILRENGFNYLPNDSRTLLSTPKYISNITQIGNGTYWHNGLKTSLVNILSQTDVSIQKVSLIFNIDGLPIANSSKTEFWPILCAIDDLPDLPIIVVGIYCGESKPFLKDFLSPFVKEMSLLLKEGINISGREIPVKIKCFVCDSPARAFVKGIVNFNAYHGCNRCTVIGNYENFRMNYIRIDCTKRTDTSFRNRSDDDHHKDYSPIEDLPVDMVNDFVVADSLHLLDLGIMKKLLLIWTSGKYTYKSKWSAIQIKEISDFLIKCNKNIPTEIHRAIRTLYCLKFWKGLEFRTFLMYIGPVILKDYLPEIHYGHFLLFYCANIICSTSAYEKYLNVARVLLEDFVKRYLNIYGAESITSNVHNLCHLVDDVVRFGSLPSFSSYKFESYLGYIKSLLRQGNNPLAQCAKRLTELSKLEINPIIKIIYPVASWKLKNNEISKAHSCEIFGRVELKKGLILSNKNKDKWFMTNENEIACMIYVTFVDGHMKIFAPSILEKEIFFEKPIKSSYLNIYKCGQKLSSPKFYNISEVKCKLVAVNYHNHIVFFPLIHTIGLMNHK